MALSASSSNTETSTPIIEAGSRPNVVSALNLPPTLGSALNTLNPDFRALSSRVVRGSVMITMCSSGSSLSSRKSFLKNLKWERVSIVVPDLDEKMIRLLAKSFGIEEII